jgi:hypothetical protein
MQINTETELFLIIAGIKKQIKYLLVYKPFDVRTFYVDNIKFKQNNCLNE